MRRILWTLKLFDHLAEINGFDNKFLRFPLQGNAATINLATIVISWLDLPPSHDNIFQVRISIFWFTDPTNVQYVVTMMVRQKKTSPVVLWRLCATQEIGYLPYLSIIIITWVHMYSRKVTSLITPKWDVIAQENLNPNYGISRGTTHQWLEGATNNVSCLLYASHLLVRLCSTLDFTWRLVPAQTLLSGPRLLEDQVSQSVHKNKYRKSREHYYVNHMGLGESSDSPFILPPPPPGYTVSFLKSINGHAKVYIRPLQTNLSMEIVHCENEVCKMYKLIMFLIVHDLCVFCSRAVFKIFQ